MINLLNFFLKHQLKRAKQAQMSKGFTLVELLIAIALSSIVIGTLLSFMNNILNSERQEQAKAITEQETQQAIDYIANDLKEAIYIYDADGINAIKSQLPNATDTNKVPVLVFWKRSFLPKERNIKDINDNSTTVGCLVKIPPNGTNCDNRDYFVYSLVSYYLIKDNSSTWSKTARIGRFEVQDAIKAPYSSNYLTSAAPGFKLFDLNQAGTTLKEKMNAWTKASTSYDLTKNKIDILVDYIDQSTNSALIPPTNFCINNPSANAQLVPVNNSTANPLGIYSFYACVDSSRNLAKVYIRGNALARLSNNATFANSKSTYFPLVSVQVKNRGLLGVQ